MVPHTSCSTISPDSRASLPTTSLYRRGAAGAVCAWAASWAVLVLSAAGSVAWVAVVPSWAAVSAVAAALAAPPSLSGSVAQYAYVNLTISIGVKPSPAGPPIVPRIPEIDLIRVISGKFLLVVYLAVSPCSLPLQWLLAVAAQSFTANLQIYKKFRSLSPSPSRYSPAGSALQNRLASLDPTADAVPPLMMPRVAQVLGGHSLPALRSIPM